MEKKVQRKLLHLACRHHILELILAHVFSLHDVSKSSNIEIFPRFIENWPQIDRARSCTALEDESLAAVIAPWKASVIALAISQLKEFKYRDDYRELLELIIIFFGDIPPRGIRFQYPGAVDYIMLAGWREPFFHKDGAVSKPVQFSEAAGKSRRHYCLWKITVNHGRGSSRAYYFTVAATLDKSLTSHCL